MNCKISLLSFLAVPAILSAGVALDVSVQINEKAVVKTVMIEESGDVQFQEAGVTVSVHTIDQDDQEIEFELCVVKDEEIISQSTFRVAWDTDAELHITDGEEMEMMMKVRPSRVNETE